MGQKPSRGPHKSGPRSTGQMDWRQGGEDAGRVAFRRAKRKKQVRRNRIIGLFVLLVLLALIILGIVGAVRFFLRQGDEPESTTSLASSLPALVDDEEDTPDEPEPEPEPPAENPDDYDYYVEGIPLLLNRYNPLPDELTGDLEVVEVGRRPDTGEMHSLVPEAAEAFLAMVEAAAGDGITLYPVSGYRNHTRQVNNYEASVGNHMAQGLSREAAEEEAGKLIAVPGTSEHEAGLAIDINSLDQSFQYTDAFAWLSEHCNDFGFILRYEATTYSETGIDYEPWHYRYVGQNHAYAISELGLTLEGYVAYLGGEVKTATGTLPAPDVSAPTGTASSTNSASSGSSNATTSGGDSGDDIPLG